MGSPLLRVAAVAAMLLLSRSAVRGQSGLGVAADTGNAADPAAGGAANADFDSLIDLIVSTVATETWAETGGGEAEIRPFPNGVWLDPAGVIASTVPEGSPAKRPRRPPTGTLVSQTDARASVALRCVSLPRLEAEIRRRSEAGVPLDEAMLTLAGLRRVERVFVYPPEGDTPGDLVLAGRAGDWRVDDEARLVATDTGEAVVRLDDLLVLLRREWSAPGTPLGCSITPRQERLAATQQVLNRTSREPLRPGRRAREAWLESVRSTLGRQDIEVFGVDPTTNAARVLVEADHHMKQVGLGVVEAADGLESYMDRVAEAASRGVAVSPLNVLRWWFATNYDGVERSADGGCYRLVGQAARVLSENQLLTLRGERVHTGRSDAATEGFANDFTAGFAEVTRRYPVYSELRNVFDLAVVATLMRSHKLPLRAAWTSTLFLDPGSLPTPRLRAATEVDTLATSRVVNRTQVLAAVSGGVWLDAAQVVNRSKASSALRDLPARPSSAGGAWWWDAAAR